MRVLLIAAHGSRRPASNDEVTELATAIAALAGDQFDRVSRAFIQFTPPLLEDQITVLVEQGATSITVFPYFIASGSHVIKDIPERVQKAREKHPGVTFEILPHLGKARGITQLVLDEVTHPRS